MARAATVLIDRAGRPAPHTAARSRPGPAAVRRLEIDAERLSVAERVARAAARIEAGTCDDTAPPDSHALRLEGRPGALCAFALEGDPSRVVESAWRALCGLEPPPRKGRGGGARQAPNSRQRR